MLLSSVILILQEILEASLILSVLLAFSVRTGLSRRWVWWALTTGVIAACIYASQVERVSEWFDYVGQEVLNACFQLAICLCLLAFAALHLITRRVVPALLWQTLMAAIVTLAIAREGFEILLYGMNFVGDEELWSPVLLGGLLGGGIGVSIGALLYYGLIAVPNKIGAVLLPALLALFAGNMASQGTLLLIQADWLPSGQALWDSNFFIPENSLLGQLLYALVGYEATPTALQAGAYGLQALVMAILFAVGAHSARKGI